MFVSADNHGVKGKITMAINATSGSSGTNGIYDTNSGTVTPTEQQSSSGTNSTEKEPEDDLQVLADEDESTTTDNTDSKNGTEENNGESSDDSLTNSEYLTMLYKKQLALTKKIQRLADSMSVVMSQYNSTKAKIDINAGNKDVDTSQLETNLSGYESRMNTLSSLISTCQGNIDSIASEINSILFKNTSTSSTSSTTGTTAADSASGTSSTSTAVAAGDVPDGYNAEKGQALANAANELYGDNPYSNASCGSGVSAAISRGLGLSISGNGCDYRDLLRADSTHFKEVTDQYPTVESLYNLPPGAIVSWQPYNTTSLGRYYGHVYIADGQGNEISDFKGAMNNEHYADGGSYTVFVPI